MRITNFIFLMFILISCNLKVFADTVEIDCPQVNGSITYHQIIEYRGYAWQVWVQGVSSLNVNTALDPDYAPYIGDSLECRGGWPNTQYSFMIQNTFESCVTNTESFTCTE